MLKRLLLVLSVIALNLVYAELVTVETYPEVNGVLPGDEVSFAVVAHIEEGWHINARSVGGEVLIPTEVRVDDNKYFRVTGIKYPPGKQVTLPFYGEPLQVYEGTVVIYVTGKVSEDVSTDLLISGVLSYQGCDDQVCSPPEEVKFSLKLPLLSSESDKKFINNQFFHVSGTIEKGENEKSQLGNAIFEKGLLLSLLLVFVGGLGLNLTPCVYPLIPITIGYFGGQAASRKGKKMFMAFLYVLGMATVNSILGSVAALTGGMLGGFLTNPVVLVLIALIMVVLALSMFGLYEIQPPAALMRLGGNIGEGYLGALLMGLTMGIVAAPCIGPFVIGLLTYVATTGNPFIGFLMFFALSMGLGIPFMILAFFSSKISSLPRSGRWMTGVRMFFGFILLAMAIYFLSPLLGGVSKYVFSFYVLGVGVYLVLFNRTAPESRVFTFVKNLIAIAAIFISGWTLRPSGHVGEEINWITYSDKVFQESIKKGKPVVIDFYADWCIPCKELEEITFSDRSVVEMSRNFTMLKVDLTFGGDSLKENLKVKYSIKGVPTVIFITKEGKERKDLRLFGFEEPQKFLRRMKELLD